MRLMVLWTVAALAAGAAAADGVLERIAATGVLRIGVRADAAPLSFIRDGAPAGYAVAVCARVAERLAEQTGGKPIRIEPVTVTAQDRFDAILQGRIDLLCGAASVTLARRAQVDFSIPIYIDGATVLMRRDDTGDFRSLAGRRIGVRDGTTTEDALRATLERAGMAADIVAVPEHAEGVARLLGRDIDAYFADQSIMVFLIAQSGRNAELALSDQPLTIEPQALAMPLGDTAFRLEVDRALSRMYRSGEIAAIFTEAFAPATMGDGMRALTLFAPLPE